jgi:hypothetical protein
MRNGEILLWSLLYFEYTVSNATMMFKIKDT